MCGKRNTLDHPDNTEDFRRKKLSKMKLLEHSYDTYMVEQNAQGPEKRFD